MEKQEKSWLEFLVCCRCEERAQNGELQTASNPERYEEIFESVTSSSVQNIDRSSKKSFKKSKTSFAKFIQTDSPLSNTSRQATPHGTSFVQVNTPQSKSQTTCGTEEEAFFSASKFDAIRNLSLKNEIQFQIASLINRTMPKIERPQLILEIVDSKEIEQKDPFLIFPRGCLNSLRGAKDGVTIFGTQNEETEDQSELIKINTCDIVIPSSENGFGQKHFAIYFNLESNSYYIVDLYQGSGTFILISKPLLIREDYIVSFGSSHINFQISQNGGIKIIFIAGQLKGKQFEFKNSDKKIKIGRHAKSDIRITENGLSRTQCQLTYSQKGWMLKDGEDTKMSTNGTWLFAGDSQTITDQMIFKAGKSILKAYLT